MEGSGSPEFMHQPCHIACGHSSAVHFDNLVVNLEAEDEKEGD